MPRYAIRPVWHLFAALVVAAFAIGWAGQARAQSSVPSSPAASPLSQDQKREVESIIQNYLRENPEIVLEAIQTLQERQRAAERERAAAAVADNRDELENDPASPVAGNPEGRVTVVEFFDYRCGYCKKVFPAVVQLLKDDGDVRYVFKEFPILTPESRVAARAALAAWKVDPGKYFAFHTAMMQARGGLSEKHILRFAEAAGLDAERIRREMESPDIKEMLERNNRLAQRLGIRGTPGFVIGGQVVPGAIDLETMRQMIDEARKS